MVLSPDEKRLYVVLRKGNGIVVIDTASRKVIDSATIGKGPEMIAISPDGKTLYVSGKAEDRLIVVSASDLRVIAKVATGKEPHGVSYRR